jgi:hypothetical protein
VCIVSVHAHFYVATFDFPRGESYILGKELSEDGLHFYDWESWNGPEYWDRVRALLRWTDVCNSSQVEGWALSLVRVCALRHYGHVA